MSETWNFYTSHNRHNDLCIASLSSATNIATSWPLRIVIIFVGDANTPPMRIFSDYETAHPGGYAPRMGIVVTCR